MFLLVDLLGAVALLLWGLRMVRTGIMRAYGAWVKKLAARAQANPVLAFLSGVIVAAMLQSSMATSMIASSFAGRGVLTAIGAFFIILGADVGTAFAVFFASQKLTWIAPVFIATGGFTFLSSDNHKRRSISRAILGVGLILLALTLISQIGVKFSHQDEIKIIIGILVKQPFLLVILAMVMTYFAHSSLAILLLAISFLSANFIDLPSALYFVLGANIGSGMLPVIANLNSPTNARIPVTANLLVRGAMAIVAFFLVTKFIEYFEPYTTLKLMPAVFHLVLNLAVVIVGIIFAKPIVGLAKSLLPESGDDGGQLEPKFLDTSSMSNTVVALTCAKREALHMAEITQKMLQSAYPVLMDNDRDQMGVVVALDDDVDHLFDAIKIYLSEMMQNQLSKEESREALDILSFTANMEHIGDIIEGGLMEMAGKKIKAQFNFSDQGQKEINALYDATVSNFELAVNTFVSGEAELAHQLYDAKSEVRKLERKSVTAHFERIGKGMVESVSTSSLHLDVVRDLKRINSHLTSIAYPVLKANNEQPKVKRG